MLNFFSFLERIGNYWFLFALHNGQKYFDIIAQQANTLQDAETWVKSNNPSAKLQFLSKFNRESDMIDYLNFNKFSDSQDKIDQWVNNILGHAEKQPVSLFGVVVNGSIVRILSSANTATGIQNVKNYAKKLYGEGANTITISSFDNASDAKSFLVKNGLDKISNQSPEIDRIIRNIFPSLNISNRL